MLHIPNFQIDRLFLSREDDLSKKVRLFFHRTVEQNHGNVFVLLILSPHSYRFFKCSIKHALDMTEKINPGILKF